MIEVRTRIPTSIAKIIDKLIERGFYSSMADFARHAIIDKIIEDYEVGIEELEPEIIDEFKGTCDDKEG